MGAESEACLGSGLAATGQGGAAVATKALLITLPFRGPREPASSGEGWETPSQASSDCLAPGAWGTGCWEGPGTRPAC